MNCVKKITARLSSWQSEKLTSCPMRFELSLETAHTMKPPVAKVAVLLLGAAALVLVFQVLQRIFAP